MKTLTELTPEQIDSIEAGPECDRLVALALGFYQDDWHGEQCWFGQHADGHNVHASCFLGIFGAASRDTDGLPKFSTSWDAAMRALEKTVQNGGPQLTEAYLTFAPEPGDCRWAISLEGDPECGPGIIAMIDAPTGPLAVCRAILKAAIVEKAEVPA